MESGMDGRDGAAASRALSINLPSMGDARDVDDPLIIID
jgi:hypothetical protein